MATPQKTKLIKKLNEVCSCKDNKYCLLKEIIVCSHQDPRFLVQLKCIEHFKYEESEKEKKDIGWEEAHIRWVAGGHAKTFAEHYDEDMDIDIMYKKIIKQMKK